MDGTEFIVAIVAIVCITSVIKTWINRNKNQNSVDEEQFNRLAKAFMQHKRDMQKRVEHLETINAEADENDDNLPEIELNDNGNRLTNDLQQKDRIRQ